MVNSEISSATHALSPALQAALTRQGAPSGLAPESLRVLTSQGQYSGRSVRYFRVFDQLKASQCQVSIRSYRDLDPHPELLVGAGHTEKNGAITLNGRVTPEGQAPTREPADRAAHLDDQHLVFWDAQAARTSSARLSEAAASWLQASSILVLPSAPASPELARR